MRGNLKNVTEGRDRIDVFKTLCSGGQELSQEFVSESEDLFNSLFWTFLHKYVVTLCSILIRKPFFASRKKFFFVTKGHPIS